MKKYKRALIFSGGGNRFAVYAGIYAALVDKGLSPDLLVGACGASLTATIISTLVAPQAIKKYLKSKEVFSLIENLSLTEERKFFKIPLYLCLRSFFLNKNLYIENIINRFLINFPVDLSKHLTQLNNKKATIPTIIIGAKLNFNESDINKKINNKNLYKEIIFTNIKEDLGIKEINKSKAYMDSIVSKDIEIIRDFSLLKASRISMADMFLISPIKYENTYFTGGAIDLLPFEIADYLAEDIILELKQKYTFIEKSTLNFVLGYNGNERFKDIIENKKATYWIDTSDMPKYFKKFYNFFRFNPFKMELQLKLPTYKEYCEDIDMQWEYGYQRALESLNFEKNSKKHQRIKLK